MDLPHYTSPQSNWTVQREGDKLRLSNHVGTYDYVVESIDQSGKAKLTKVDKHDMSDMQQHKQLQVHKSDSKGLYATMHEGTVNPTFRITQNPEGHWDMTFKRPYSNPHKVMFDELLKDKDQFMKGMAFEAQQHAAANPVASH